MSLINYVTVEDARWSLFFNDRIFKWPILILEELDGTDETIVGLVLVRGGSVLQSLIDTKFCKLRPFISRLYIRGEILTGISRI